MSNTAFKPGQRIHIEGYGEGVIRNITPNKVFVEFTNPAKRQYTFNLEELEIIKPETPPRLDNIYNW